MSLDLRDECGSETVCAEFQLCTDAVKRFARTLSARVEKGHRVELACGICSGTDGEDAIGEFPKPSTSPTGDKRVVVVREKCCVNVERASEYVACCRGGFSTIGVRKFCFCVKLDTAKISVPPFVSFSTRLPRTTPRYPVKGW